jgi:hypothetical protein
LLHCSNFPHLFLLFSVHRKIEESGIIKGDALVLKSKKGVCQLFPFFSKRKEKENGTTVQQKTHYINFFTFSLRIINCRCPLKRLLPIKKKKKRKKKENLILKTFYC